MRVTIAIICVSIIFFQSFSRIWIVLSFKINQDYLAEVFCINRQKPELHCKGKCILMQRMKAKEEQDKKEIPQQINNLNEITYYIQDAALDFISEIRLTNSNVEFNRSPDYFSTFQKGIFHPPQLA